MRLIHGVITKLVLVMLLPLSIYYLVDTLLRLDLPPENFYQNEDFTSIPVGDNSYPYYKLIASEVDYNAPLVSGVMYLTPTRGEIKEHLYIPYFSGNLTVFLNDALIFDSNDDKKKIPPNKYKSALIPLEDVYVNQRNTIEITLRKSSRVFAALSHIYIGSNAHFTQAVHVREIITEKLPLILWGVTSLVLLSLGFIFFSTRDVAELLPILAIALFIFCGTTSIVFSDFFSVGSLTKYVMNFSLMLVAATHSFQENLLSKTEENDSTLIFPTVVSLSLLVVGLFFPSAVHLINLFVNAPIMIIGLLYLMNSSSRHAIRGGGYKPVFLAMSVFGILLAFLHDILIRFGVFQEGVFLLTLGLSIFFASVILIFTHEVFKLRNSLQNQEEILRKRLAEREVELSIENNKNIELVKNSTKLNENARLTRDLHDGVLTYLSMIQALSESQESSEKRTISKISRYASQEIRLILDNGVEKDQNTFVMLATFRQQVVEPLIDQGVSVDWKLLCLMDQDIIPTSSSLNLFRIFQEAFHNAHVRAQCKHIEVKAEIHEASVVKIIIVNSGGVTFDPTGKSGNGIINMKRRALMIDASFDIHPIPSGAKVELIFNLHSPVVLQSVIKST